MEATDEAVEVLMWYTDPPERGVTTKVTVLL